MLVEALRFVEFLAAVWKEALVNSLFGVLHLVYSDVRPPPEQFTAVLTLHALLARVCKHVGFQVRFLTEGFTTNSAFKLTFP